MTFTPNIKPPNERRRPDIDPENTWIVSDTHFGHDNIVGYCFRPEDHEEVMLAEWRAHVPDDATVIHLGDISYGHNGGDTRFKRIIAPELTGKRKLLIKGNHDRKTHKFYKDCGFKLAMPFSIGIDYTGKWVPDVSQHGYIPEYGGAIVSFSHYPWNTETDGEQRPWDWRLHGHIHNKGYTRNAYVPFLRNHINLSVEQTKYQPVNLKLLLDAAIFGKFPETTQAQLDEAAARKVLAQAGRLK